MSNFPNQNNRSNGESARSESENNAEAVFSDDVDLSVLLEFEKAQCAGEPDLVVELIDLYLAEVPHQLSAIKDSISTADEVSLKRAAHNLKGSSANLGVESVARLCRELEQMDFVESPQKINVCVGALEQTFARVRRILSAERRNRTSAAS